MLKELPPKAVTNEGLLHTESREERRGMEGLPRLPLPQGPDFAFSSLPLLSTLGLGSALDVLLGEEG